jgi:hypothetical protein
VVLGFALARANDFASRGAAESPAVRVDAATPIAAPLTVQGDLSIPARTPEAEAATERALGAAAQPIPRTLGCVRLAVSTCRAIVRAALDILEPGATVASASAWPSLLCRDSVDCPPARLEAAQPMGSAVLQFADGRPTAWVNVVRVVVGPNHVSDGMPLQAWFVTHPG